MSSADHAALYHYPRRFRWEVERDRDKGRDMAILHVNGRHAGGLIRYSNRRGWYTWGEDWCELHRAPFARRATQSAPSRWQQ